jgi:hypothetical protein
MSAKETAVTATQDEGLAWTVCCQPQGDEMANGFPTILNIQAPTSSYEFMNIFVAEADRSGVVGLGNRICALSIRHALCGRKKLATHIPAWQGRCYTHRIRL